MDSVDFGGLFAFTTIDIYTREAEVLLAPELTARYGSCFLTNSMARRFDSHVHLIQTDDGPEFKADFLKDVSAFCDRHRIARPYKKNEQSYIESFNRTLRKECTALVEAFLRRYHYHQPHLGLGMRPPLTTDRR